MVTQRLIPNYCRDCMHWVATHGVSGCMYRGCTCSVGQDVLMAWHPQKKNSEQS